MMMAEKTQWKFTGRHALLIFCSAFAIIIGVNITLAVKAVSTFPGLEVKNSYVASQEFNARSQAQRALGWDVNAEVKGDLLHLMINDQDGQPVEVAKLTATFGRATHVKDDQTPEFTFDGSAYVAPVTVGKGNWNLRMVARAKNGTEFTQRVIVHVREVAK